MNCSQNAARIGVISLLVATCAKCMRSEPEGVPRERVEGLWERMVRLFVEWTGASKRSAARDGGGDGATELVER